MFCIAINVPTKVYALYSHDCIDYYDYLNEIESESDS